MGISLLFFGSRSRGGTANRERRATIVHRRAGRFDRSLGPPRNARSALASSAAALASTAKAPAAELPKARPSPHRDPKADGQEFLAAFPEQRIALIEIGKVQIHRGYGAFYRQAGLTTEQIAGFETIISGSWADNAQLSPNGIYPDGSHVPLDQLKEVLGDKAFGLYQSYRQAEPAYNIALQLATAATNAGAPAVSAEQADQLAQAILSSDPGFQSGRRLNPDATNWDNVMSRAATILSPAQLQVAQALLLNQNYRTALANAMRAATLTGAPAPKPE